MKTVFVLSLLLLVAAPPALAQTQPLNLKLKDDTSLSVTGDPPGTYYGDHSGPAVAADDTTARPPSELDDGKAHVHGAITTGMGWSKGYGSSTYNAADLSVSKAFTSDEGRTSVLRMDIHVSKSDGPFGGYGPYGGYYDRPHPGPRSASGMAMRWSADDDAQ